MLCCHGISNTNNIAPWVHGADTVKEGLVERISSENDRRSCKVVLTSKGIALVNVALNAHVENMDKMLEVLTDNEQKQLAKLLRKILIIEENDN